MQVTMQVPGTTGDCIPLPDREVTEMNVLTIDVGLPHRVGQDSFESLPQAVVLQQVVVMVAGDQIDRAVQLLHDFVQAVGVVPTEVANVIDGVTQRDFLVPATNHLSIHRINVEHLTSDEFRARLQLDDISVPEMCVRSEVDHVM